MSAKRTYVELYKYDAYNVKAYVGTYLLYSYLNIYSTYGCRVKIVINLSKFKKT